MFKLVVLIFFLGQEEPQGPLEAEQLFYSYTDCMVEAVGVAQRMDREPDVVALLVACQRVPEADL